jgi:hypothetical protein
MDLNMSVAILAVFFTLLVLATYFLPTIVATVRNHPATLPIFLLNLSLGWTLLGWVGALIWSALAVNTQCEALS